MSPTSFSRCILLILLFTTCTPIVHGKGGRGGGSRGGGSRGGGWGGSSSSRSSSSSSSSSSSGGYSSRHGSSSSSGSGSSFKYGSSSSSGSGSSFKYGSSSPSAGGSSSRYGSSSGSGSSSFKYPSSSSSVKDHSYFSRGSGSHTPTSIGELNTFLAQERAKMDAALKAHRTQSHFPKSTRNSQFPEANYPRQQFSYNPAVSSGTSHQGTASQGILNANYPRQPISSIQGIPSHTSFPQPGISNANYPRRPSPQETLVPSVSSTFQGIPHANYPKQSILPNPSIHSPSSSSISNANYPRQPNLPQTFGSSSQQGFPNVNYPRQGINPNPSVPLVRSPPLGHQLNQPGQASGLHSPHSGISSANYPRQQYNHQSLPPQVLGSGVWNPKSGMPAPVYMNYGGLPTGANMYNKPIKKQGFMGSLMSMGGSSKSYKNKHYASYPSPYGLGGGMPANVMGGFMGNKGSKKAMYTILPYMAARKSSKLFKPKFGFYGYRPIGYHSYHHHHSYVHDPEYTRVHYDVYNNEYVGRCNRPINPDHAKVVCNSTHNQVDCGVTCEEGYRYPDNTTTKTNKCWHVSGKWNPTKNFPGCKPVCDKPCLNGGKCVSPGVCSCSSEYRGPHCESHFLNCDIRKLANGTKILWVCTHTKNETSCRVKCKPPAKFVPESELFYKCTPDGVWTPSNMPLCVVPPGSEEQNVTKIPEEHITKETA